MANGETVTLYPPVGQKELDPIAVSGYREFPPRLPNQSTLYPVLAEEHAAEVAREWNVEGPGSGYVGYVMRFKVRAEFLKLINAWAGMATARRCAAGENTPVRRITA